MEPRGQYKISFGGSLSPVVKLFIIINIIVFILLNIAKDPSLIQYIGLVPSSLLKDRYLWQLVTYMFIHVDFWHVLFNMLALWWFGCDIERNFGRKYFLRYYFFTGIGAGIFAVILGWGSPIPIIGASGAIFGILLAYAILFPNRKIYLWFVLPVKAKWVVLAFAGMEVFAIMRAKSSGISHSAHVGGLIFGLLWFGYYLKFFSFGFLRNLFKKRKSKTKIRVLNIDDENVIEIQRDDNDTIH